MQDKQQEKEILKFIEYFIKFYKLPISKEQILKNLLSFHRITYNNELTEKETIKQIKIICNNTIEMDNKINYPLFKI